MRDINHKVYNTAGIMLLGGTISKRFTLYRKEPFKDSTYKPDGSYMWVFGNTMNW